VDLKRLMLYVNILGICLPLALTYVIIINIFLGLPVEPVSVFILAFGYAVMIKRNFVFQELWERWFGR